MTHSWRGARVEALGTILLAATFTLTAMFGCSWLQTRDSDGARVALRLEEHAERDQVVRGDLRGGSGSTDFTLASCNSARIEYRLLDFRVCCDASKSCNEHRIVRRHGEHETWVWSGRIAFAAMLASCSMLILAVWLRTIGRRVYVVSGLAVGLALLGYVSGVVFTTMRASTPGITLVRGAGVYVSSLGLVAVVASVLLLRATTRADL